MTIKIPAATAFLLIGVSACATQPPAPSAQPGQAFSASSDAPPKAREKKILDLLAGGDVAPARLEAQALVAEQPDDREARTLLQEIDEDPKTLLGAVNFNLTAKVGDTFASLAEAYLHDRGLAYALARYNGVNPPNQPTAGQTVLIPGSPSAPGRAEAPRRREPAEAPHARPERPAPTRPLSERPASRPAPERPAPPKPAPPKPAPPASEAPAPHDPAKAASLRSDALVLMNKGDIDHAVSLLRQAASLDPDSAPIKGDLDRALRIQHGSHPGGGAA